MESVAVVEAILFVSTDPVSLGEINKKTGLDESIVEEAVDELTSRYSGGGYGIMVSNSKAGVQMRVKPELEQQVLGFIPETDMSEAAMKTLALIAYEQPIKQSYIVKIRGNRAYRYIKELLSLELIEARKSGHTKILSTTPKFKKYFRLTNENRMLAKK